MLALPFLRNSMSIIEFVGTFVALALLATVGGLLAKHTFVFYWEESAKGKDVDGLDILFSLQKPTLAMYRYLLKEAVGTLAASVAFFILAQSPALSLASAIGYSALVFAVTGVLTPRVLREVKPEEGLAQEKSPGQQ